MIYSIFIYMMHIYLLKGRKLYVFFTDKGGY